MGPLEISYLENKITHICFDVDAASVVGSNPEVSRSSATLALMEMILKVAIVNLFRKKCLLDYPNHFK